MPRIKHNVHCRPVAGWGSLGVTAEVQTSLCAPTSQWLGQTKPPGAAPITFPLDDVMLALMSSAGKRAAQAWPGRTLARSLCLLPLPLCRGAQLRVPQPPLLTDCTALSTWTFLSKSQAEQAYRAPGPTVHRPPIV